MEGIVGYGVYVPRYRIRTEEIARAHSRDTATAAKGLLIEEKAVAGLDEDSATIAVAASRNALLRARISATRIGGVYAGSESHAYAVKPDAGIIGEALAIGHRYMAADLEFACKAGTAAMQIALGLIKAGMIDYGLAVGADTGDGRPGDVLEYSAAAGGAAFILGRENVIAEIEATCSYSSDTPDFWRRELQQYPRHAERFTGPPAYFRHTVEATNALLKETGLLATDFDHVVFHMPNGKYPLKAAALLGIPPEKLNTGLVVSRIGNTFSASSLIGLASVLDGAGPDERILMTSFGSGAGSDAFSIRTTDAIVGRAALAPTTTDYVDDRHYLTYADYLQHTGGVK
jgi:hydroxymethylglutaryl-CoA synthase